ncbi:MAG: hypothetical protein OJF55_001089 [Rhodanobacteraceae bacterium]|jgi:AraC-like DNA-binding protein/CheY-like chemotaxis protein|nr:MAG: hypothetical protein OJF55_001089 [Rhodanobacteraceae bacterium]
MAAIRILWFDLRRRHDEPGLADLVSGKHALIRFESAGAISSAIGNAHPHVVCVEFDYPDEARLAVVPAIVRELAGLPLLMFTEYHSEALAVRAFRWGVWDYRVKPVDRAILEHSIQLATTAAIGRMRRGGSGASMTPELVAPGGHLGGFAMTTARTAAAVAYITRHYAEPIDRRSMAARCHLSVSEFSRVFRREHGRTFERFLLEFRVGQARELLVTSRLSIMQLAHATGFNDSSYFARVFKRLVGMSASDWRKRALTAD